MRQQTLMRHLCHTDHEYDRTQPCVVFTALSDNTFMLLSHFGIKQWHYVSKQKNFVLTSYDLYPMKGAITSLIALLSLPCVQFPELIEKHLL